MELVREDVWEGLGDSVKKKEIFGLSQASEHI